MLDEFTKQRCKPNVRTFSTLMHYLCAKGDVSKAFQMIKRIKNEGINVDTVTFNILISRLRKQEKIMGTKELLEKMRLTGSYQEVLYGLLDVGKLLLFFFSYMSSYMAYCQIV